MPGIPEILNRPGIKLPTIPKPSGGTISHPHPVDEPGKQRKVALVLSGGSACGSFEVGALDYLYEHVFSDPKIGPPVIISGTSVGAISAAKLAEGGPNAAGGTLESQKAALAGLKKLWLELKSEQDMYTETDMIQYLNKELKDVRDMLAADGVHNVLPDDVVGFLDKDIPTVDKGKTLGNLVNAYTAPVGVAWGVWDLVSQLETRAKAKVLDILEQLTKQPTIYTLNPIHEKLRKPENFDPKKIRKSGTKLRVAVVGLNSGELRYMNEHGDLMHRDTTPIPAPKASHAAPHPPSGKQEKHVPAHGKPIEGLPGGDIGDPGGVIPGTPPVPDDILISGVLASATEPVIFGVVPIHDEWYVDGGVREILPAEIVLRDDESYKIYAVQTTTPMRCKKGDWDITKNDVDQKYAMLNVSGRLLDIFLDEIELSDMKVAWAQTDMEFVFPTIDAHGGMTIDPTLIRIGIANGYMRAAEVHQNIETSLSLPSAGDITAIRLQIVEAEKQSHSGGGKVVDPKNPNAPDPGVHHDLKAWQELVKLKEELKQKVELRVAKVGADTLPPGAQDWWKHWETKPDSTEIGPWVSSK